MHKPLRKQSGVVEIVGNNIRSKIWGKNSTKLWPAFTLFIVVRNDVNNGIISQYPSYFHNEV